MVTHCKSAVWGPDIITMPTSFTLADEGTTTTRIAYWEVAKSDGNVFAAQCDCIDEMQEQKNKKESTREKKGTIASPERKQHYKLRTAH